MQSKIQFAILRVVTAKGCWFTDSFLLVLLLLVELERVIPPYIQRVPDIPSVGWPRRLPSIILGETRTTTSSLIFDNRKHQINFNGTLHSLVVRLPWAQKVGSSNLSVPILFASSTMVVYCTVNAGVSGSSPDWQAIWRGGRIGKCVGLENRSPHGHGGSKPSLSANLRWAGVPSASTAESETSILSS